MGGGAPAPVGLPNGAPEGSNSRNLGPFVDVDVFVGRVDRDAVGRVFVERL